jgi:phage FluMu protein gp41
MEIDAHFIVTQAGEVAGPYSAEWIRQNTAATTLVSYEQRWLRRQEHPAFREVASSRDGSTRSSETKPDIHYIVTQTGEVEGPYSPEWIRQNTAATTLVSHEQRWLRQHEHPAFRELAPSHAASPRASEMSNATHYIVAQTGEVEGPHSVEWIRQNTTGNTLVSHEQRWLRRKEHPAFREVTPSRGDAMRALLRVLDAWRNTALLTRAVVLLIVAIAVSTLVMTFNVVCLHPGRSIPTELLNCLMISISWLLLFAIFLVPAYLIGRLFGGRATAIDVFHGFASTVFALYISIPIALLTYTLWFAWLWDNNLALALLLLMCQVLIVPFFCIYYVYKGLRAFVRSMAFAAPWQGWATLGAATAVCTLSLLLLGGWFEWFRAFLAAM